MLIEVKVPEVGESITEGTLVEWLQADGAVIVADDPLFELETDKITMEVVAQESGRLKILVEAGALVQIDQVVAQIDTDAATTDSHPAVATPDKPPTESKEQPPPEPASEPAPPLAPAAGFDQAQAKLADSASAPLSPAVRRLVNEQKLDPGSIPATGRDGRLTKGDVLTHMKTDSPAKPVQAPTKAQATAPVVEPVQPPPASDGPRQTRQPLSRLRQRIAERLVEAQQNAAILTTFNEVDMSHVIEMRSRLKEGFEKKHGVRLGFMSFFVKAAVDALKTVPSLNAQIDGDTLIQNHFYDIGVAVGTERGLVVPVLRDCDTQSFADIEKGIGEYAAKVKNKTINLQDLSGGVFTISNGGVYGSLMSTPILNPPQSGILGMHATKKRAVVVDDQIVIRPMMYLALSYDHRIVDGKDAVTFLKRIVECIENPERMLLEA